MISDSLKKLYDIKAPLKEAVQSINQDIEVTDRLADYPELIHTVVNDDWYAGYFVKGPDYEEKEPVDGGYNVKVWATGRCIFDEDNSHLVNLYVKDERFEIVN